MRDDPKLIFAAFRRWCENAGLRGEVAGQAALCLRHVGSLDLNLPDPHPALLVGAREELLRLEHLISATPSKRRP